MRLVPLEVFLGTCYFGWNCCEPPMVHLNMKPSTYCPCGNQKSSGSPLPTHGLWNRLKHGISLTATARRNHLPKLSYLNSWSSVVWTHFRHRTLIVRQQNSMKNHQRSHTISDQRSRITRTTWHLLWTWQVHFALHQNARSTHPIKPPKCKMKCFVKAILDDNNDTRGWMSTPYLFN